MFLTSPPLVLSCGFSDNSNKFIWNDFILHLNTKNIFVGYRFGVLGWWVFFGGVVCFAHKNVLVGFSPPFSADKKSGLNQIIVHIIFILLTVSWAWTYKFVFHLTWEISAISSNIFWYLTLFSLLLGLQVHLLVLLKLSHRSLRLCSPPIPSVL